MMTAIMNADDYDDSNGDDYDPNGDNNDDDSNDNNLQPITGLHARAPT